MSLPVTQLWEREVVIDVADFPKPVARACVQFDRDSVWPAADLRAEALTRVDAAMRLPKGEPLEWAQFRSLLELALSYLTAADRFDESEGA